MATRAHILHLCSPGSRSHRTAERQFHQPMGVRVLALGASCHWSSGILRGLDVTAIGDYCFNATSTLINTEQPVLPIMCGLSTICPYTFSSIGALFCVRMPRASIPIGCCAPGRCPLAASAGIGMPPLGLNRLQANKDRGRDEEPISWKLLLNHSMSCAVSNKSWPQR